MKNLTSPSIIVAIVLCSTNWALGQQRPNSLDALLLRPEIVLAHRDKLQLSDQQTKDIELAIQAFESESQALQNQVEVSTNRLAELLAADKIDEQAALAQQRNVLAAEQRVKQLQLKLTVRLRNSLTADQRRRARQLQSEVDQQVDFQQRLESKQARIEKERQRLAKLSFDALSAEVDALKKPEVAWRKIAWKSCLLDGIAASRQQQKPIMLWIFIDRPIDDERC